MLIMRTYKATTQKKATTSENAVAVPVILITFAGAVGLVLDWVACDWLFLGLVTSLRFLLGISASGPFTKLVPAIGVYKPPPTALARTPNRGERSAPPHMLEIMTSSAREASLSRPLVAVSKKERSLE
jgi:hypothetical protein